uniref:glutamine--tRNA ligase n=1 Tax=Amorphochlora amoebiformis TaxID=1561963 RepID=A0A7S0DNC9_9EUKA|mmetsp:Transcript_34818/g.56160  ORF Transcript_34818/g.56160 Transcript_34818/m.56160 type:complete len:776 (+) Transcript_34818:93-2420(+)
MSADDVKLFLSIGLDKKKAELAAKNEKVCAKLKAVIEAAGVTGGCDGPVALLLFTVATRLKTMTGVKNLKECLAYVLNGKIKTPPQVTELLTQLTKGPEIFDPKSFETACGVGVVLTEADVRKTVSKVFERNDSLLAKDRYRAMGKVFGQVRGALKFANGKVVKDVFDELLLKKLGPKTEQDKKKVKNKPKANPKGTNEEEKTDDSTNVTSLNAHQLTSLLKGRDIPWAKNSEAEMKAHRTRTGGLMRTRFPPEPNGYLHIGHAKAMNFNFGVAKKFGGVTYLRFDDTNPEAEKKEYIDNIIENVKFMGHSPWKITYSSDSFEKLYEFAVGLIKKNKAFVCHMKGEDIQDNKKLGKKQKPSPWRNRPINESLYEFERMRRGYYAEGEAILRLKMDIKHDNPNMWDIVAYRVILRPHPHTGDKWCIYPTYDYTHCIIDSLEDITHSLCTMEFENRRESYYWLLDEIDIFKPNVWEYGRLNIESNVLSKRKLKHLVMAGFVSGWDDPRLLTINGLRRRGFTAEGINAFCDAMGVSRSVVVWAPYERLEQCGRGALNHISPRRMVVLDPLKVVLTNVDEKLNIDVKSQDFPDSLGVADNKKYLVKLHSTVYIERKDFRVEANKNYFGLTPGKTVRLLHAFNITCEKYDTSADGKVSTVYCKVDLNNKKKLKKGFLHWVSAPPGKTPLTITARLYEKLFVVDRPGEEGNYLDQLNKNSLRVVQAYANPELASAKVDEHYQFERLGFFYVDPSSSPKKLVFNRTMALASGIKKRTGGKKS